jgi:hypothetical protein
MTPENKKRWDALGVRFWEVRAKLNAKSSVEQARRALALMHEINQELIRLSYDETIGDDD